MGILDQIRSSTVERVMAAEGGFDAPRPYRSHRGSDHMTRIVEGADDLARTTPTIPSTMNTQAARVTALVGEEPMRDAQTRYVYVLTRQLREINPDAADAGAEWFGRNMDTLTKDQASTWINRLKAKIAEGPVASTKAPVSSTPADRDAWKTWRELAAKLVEVGGRHGARFAVDTEKGAENKIAFWWIVRHEGADGKVKYFLRQVIGGQDPVRVRMSPAAMVGVARKIEAAGPLEAMLRYGKELGHCGHCNRELTNDVSRELGIGPRCRKGKGI